MKNSTIITLDWCPSHCNIEGNDMADKAAKSGSEVGQFQDIKLSKNEGT